MIWALLTWYFFGGASGISANLLTLEGLSDLKEQVEISVTEARRREEALQILAGLKTDVQTFERAFAKSGRQLNRLYKDHAAKPDQALAVLGALNSEWEESQQDLLDSWFELRQTLTEDEWNRLFDPP